MNVYSTKGIVLLGALLLGAIGCQDSSSPTSLTDAPEMMGSSSDGLLHTNPLFRAVGPRFEMSGLMSQSDGFLTAAADMSGSTVYAARRTKAIYKDEIQTVKVDPATGATIQLKEAGMRVVIPAGALPGNDVMVVTVQAYAGKYHVYEFLPHGIQFNSPIRVEFDIANVEVFGEELAKRLAELGKYSEKLAECEKRQEAGESLDDTCKKIFFLFDDYNEDKDWYEAAVSSAGFIGVYFTGDVFGTGDLKALEIFGVKQSADNLTFQTTHFSGYALGM